MVRSYLTNDESVQDLTIDSGYSDERKLMLETNSFEESLHEGITVITAKMQKKSDNFKSSPHFLSGIGKLKSSANRVMNLVSLDIKIKPGDTYASCRKEEFPL